MGQANADALEIFTHQTIALYRAWFGYRGADYTAVATAGEAPAALQHVSALTLWESRIIGPKPES
jgi:hypothetical protein